MIAPIAVLNMAIETVNTGLSTASVAEGAVSDAEGTMNMVETATTSAAGMLQTTASSMWNYMKSMAMFTKQQATSLASNSFNIAKQKAIQAENRAGQIALNIKDEAKQFVRDGKDAIKGRKTFTFLYKIFRKLWPIFKWVFIMCNLLHGWGLWFVKLIEVIIYRIFHIKDCFLWYSLEIIGFILYAPIEFIVWLFALHSIESAFWELLNDFDENFIYGITGFYLFHYSDTVLKKCYSKKIPPFPYAVVPFDDGEFTEEAFIEFMINWFLPPTPEEIGEGVSEAVEIMKKSQPVIAKTSKILADDIADMFVISPPNPDEVKDSMGDIFKI